MTITLTATAGSASANTYVTLADAETYMETLYYKDSWTGKTDEQKKGAIVQACRLLDTLAWKGIKAADTQALEWPRSNVTDRNGYEVSDSTIPAWLANANAEFAMRLLGEDRQADMGANAPQRSKVGPLEVENIIHQTIPMSVMDIIGIWVEGGPSGNYIIRS